MSFVLVTSLPWEETFSFLFPNVERLSECPCATAPTPEALHSVALEEPLVSRVRGKQANCLASNTHAFRHYQLTSNFAPRNS